MSVSSRELKQSAENASVIPLFGWGTCPPQFYKIFQAVVAAKSNSLTLSGLHIDLEEVPCILAFLNENPAITILDVSHNYLGAEGFLALIQGNTTLKSLDISNNGFFVGQLIGGGNAFEALEHNTTLESLIASANGLDDEDAVILARNTTLKILNLSNNNICSKGAIALANNTTLASLDVTDNPKIGFPGIQALMQVNQNRIKEWQNQKWAFLIGMHPKVGTGSSVLPFLENTLCEHKTLLEVFALMKPAPFIILIDSFSHMMMNTVLSGNICLSSSSPSLACVNANNAANSEDKETKEYAELRLLGLDEEQGSLMHAIAQSVMEFNVLPHQSINPSEVLQVTPVIFSSHTPLDASLSSSNPEAISEVTTAPVVQVVHAPTVETPEERRAKISAALKNRHIQ